MRKFWLFLGLLPISGFCASPAAAVSIGFEASEGYTLGPLCPASGGQQGWSGGSQPGCTNNDPGDEEIVDSEAYAGSNSWHYARGYGSPGPGTPFSPPMSGVAGPGTRFEFSIHFKAASASGDGSKQNIYMGTPAGNDRTGFNVYLTNDAAGDGLHLHTIDWINDDFSTQVFATQLSRTSWHELSVVATFGAAPADDVYEYSVDGSLLYTGNSWPNLWRIESSHPIVYGNSIKFADDGGDTPAHDGFYYDSLLYDYANIPEPHTALLLLAGLVGLAAARRSTADR